MGLLPGVAKVKKQLDEANIDDSMIKRQEAIISSMTKEERKKPDVLNASRKRRIAAGSGVEVQDINRLLKQHRQMADAVKMMSRGGGKGLMNFARQMAGQGGMGGADLARLKAMGGGKLPQMDPNAPMPDLGNLPNMPGLPGLGGMTPPGIPGSGGLPGLPGFKPKK
jgi:signal recognition particle subunit SRP54